MFSVFKSRALVAGSATALVIGLLGTVAAPNAANAAVDKKNIILVASVINTTNPYMASNIAGAQALGKKLGVPVKIVDSQGSSQVSISKIQAILASNPGKTIVLFVNTVSSSDAPTIVNAVKKAKGYVTIWWNKPDNLNPAKIGDSFVAFQKHPGVESGKCNADALSTWWKGKCHYVPWSQGQHNKRDSRSWV
jgi:ribose transport system substrate-binding protein